MSARPPIAFVFAPCRRRAVEWCRSNGVQPYARTTVLLTGRFWEIDRSIRGHRFQSDDRLVYVGIAPASLRNIVAPARYTLKAGEEPREEVA